MLDPPSDAFECLLSPRAMMMVFLCRPLNKGLAARCTFFLPLLLVLQTLVCAPTFLRRVGQQAGVLILAELEQALGPERPSALFASTNRPAHLLRRTATCPSRFRTNDYGVVRSMTAWLSTEERPVRCRRWHRPTSQRNTFGIYPFSCPPPLHIHQ